MDKKDAMNMTYTHLLPVVEDKFLPEHAIQDDRILREDYEKLRITYELQRDIGSEIKIDLVLNIILERTFEFLHFDRGSILLTNKQGKLQQRAVRTNSKTKKPTLSKTLLNHVIKNRKGVISSDVLADQRFKMADSLMFSGIRSSIAVPLLHREEILGVILVESSKRVGAFKEKDLQLMMTIANHAAQFIKNSLLHEELKRSFNSAIRTLSAIVDARHPLTAGHSERVAKYALHIGQKLGLSGERMEALNYAALLHDIGKIGIPDRILLKQGPFEPDEREEMNNHPQMSREILENFHFPKAMRHVPAIAGLHHERIDGKGYPKGLKGSELPLEAKIVAVADVFDALTSARDYPKYDGLGTGQHVSRIPIQKAVEMIDKEVGTHFEARIVAAFKHSLPPVLLRLRGTHFEPEYVDAYISAKAPDLVPRLRPLHAAPSPAKEGKEAGNAGPTPLKAQPA